VVEVRSLESIWSDLQIKGRTLLKTDTQGFDLEVVRGAGERLAEIPATLMEVAVSSYYEGSPLILDVLGEMNRFGFELTGAFPIGRYGASGTKVLEFDCTFVNLRFV
jgi:hypothetical protein